MKFEATDKELFEMYSEYNQLYGMLIGMFTEKGRDKESAKLFAEKGFPHFCKMKDQINTLSERLQPKKRN